MSVDFRALTISFDALYVACLAVQFALCAFLLIRSRQSLPSSSAILVLLGGITLLLADDATSLAEDVRKTNVVPWARYLNNQSIIFQIAESLLGSFGYNIVLASVLIMLYRSAKDTKIQARMGIIVAVGGFTLLVRLGLAVGAAAYLYQSNLAHIQYRGPISGWVDQMWKDFYVFRGLTTTDLVLSGVFIVVLVLGGLPNPVNRLRNGIIFGIIPALLVTLALSSINSGLYYTGLRTDILSDPAYIYSNTILSNVTSITISACILYVGWGWVVAVPSYVTQPSVEDMDRKP